MLCPTPQAPRYFLIIYQRNLSRIFVTGMGAISAIGATVASNRESLVEGKCGITTLGLFPSAYSGKLPCGEIKISTKELKEKLFTQAV